MPLVGIVMGSKSDSNVMQPALDMLSQLGVEYEANVISAHRNPEKAKDYARNAHERGIEVIIAGAGKAAHLPGIIASWTALPVIGVPIASGEMGGLDSLLSIVQMSTGVPVACVAVDGAENAALLAAQILGIKYYEIRKAFEEYRRRLAEG